MSKLAHKLKFRIQIQEAHHEITNFTQGYGLKYKVLDTIWAGIEDKSASAHVRTANKDGHTDTYDTKFLVRWSSVKNMGAKFSPGFSSGVDSVPDINPIKVDQVIFVQVGSNPDVGRRFRIILTNRDERFKEFLHIYAKEMEEVGTGGAP